MITLRKLLAGVLLGLVLLTAPVYSGLARGSYADASASCPRVDVDTGTTLVLVAPGPTPAIPTPPPSGHYWSVRSFIPVGGGFFETTFMLVQITYVCPEPEPTPEPTSIPAPDAYPLYTMWLLTRDSPDRANYWQCLIISEAHPSVGRQNALCFTEQFDGKWVADTALCAAPVMSNNTWACDKYSQWRRK